MTIVYSRFLEKGGSRLRKLLVAYVLAIALAISALATPASAQDASQGTIEAFIGSNLVNVQGYPANTEVTIEVIRGDVTVATVTGQTDADGFAEFNHVGGGQVGEGGDCFRPPASPDIMPGDTIRAVAGTVDNSAVVRDLGVDFETIDTNVAAGTITVSGHARSLPNAELTPGADILELRLNKGSADLWDSTDRKDLRVDIGENVQADGSWTRTLNVGTQDAQDWSDSPGEVSLEWSAAPPAGDEEVDPPSIFVANEAEGPGALAGCPTLAEDALTDSSHSVVNTTNVGRNMILGGVSFGATGVNVSVPGGAQHAATITPVNDAAPNEHQTWTATIPAAELGALPQGRFDVSAAFAGPGVRQTPSTLSILKDTIAPRRPTATPGAGRYARTQQVTLSSEARASIHYTVNGSRPTANSLLFRRPVPITATQTLRAIAIDGVGNTSQISSFRYTILRRSFVSINRRPAVVNLGRRVLVTGRVFPAHPGKRVKVVINRPGRDLVRNVRIRANGRYVLRYKPNRPGRHFVRARFAGDADHSGSVSVRKVFRVRR